MHSGKLGKTILVGFMLVIFIPVHAFAQGTSQDTAMLYATATWHSISAMLPDEARLPADHMRQDGSLAEYTSPTNMASYIWSAIAARDLGIITADEAASRISRLLEAIAGLERHEESGQFYNWYHPVTREVLTRWPLAGGIVCPFLSSVDNGWLATALLMTQNAIPELASNAQDILQDMDFGFYYDPQVGLLRGGYWPPERQAARSGCETGYTGHHYGTLNTEPRIASYVAIALGQVPPSHYFRMWRTFPMSCDWGWQEMRPKGENVTYSVVDSLPDEPERVTDITVFEGHYVYRGMRIVPSWGGSMFEALMPNLFVPEAIWGPKNWGINHPLYVQAQIEHGLIETQYGYWGFSPASEPPEGYREYGVDALGMLAEGYASDADRTYVDYGFGNCAGRDVRPVPDVTDYRSGVVTPHAAFLALEFAPGEVFENLDNLRTHFDIYNDDYGFYDSVQVNNGSVAEVFLALDQGMIMAALANYQSGGVFREYFAVEIEPTVRPLLEVETFTVGKD